MKEEIMREIAAKMYQHDISVEDMAAFLRKNPEMLRVKYDLLCLVNGNFMRLPFEKGKDENPVGIFPFIGPLFFEFEEKTDKLRCNVMENDLPDVNIWRHIFPILDTLNAQLFFMGKPQLKGEYFARTNHANVVVNLSGAEFDFNVQDYNHPAKTRYCGKYTNGSI